MPQSFEPQQSFHSQTVCLYPIAITVTLPFCLLHQPSPLLQVGEGKIIQYVSVSKFLTLQFTCVQN